MNKWSKNGNTRIKLVTILMTPVSQNAEYSSQGWGVNSMQHCQHLVLYLSIFMNFIDEMVIFLKIFIVFTSSGVYIFHRYGNYFPLTDHFLYKYWDSSFFIDHYRILNEWLLWILDTKYLPSFTPEDKYCEIRNLVSNT